MKIRLHERKIVAKNVTKKFSGRPLLPLTLLPTGFFDNGTTRGGSILPTKFCAYKVAEMVPTP